MPMLPTYRETDEDGQVTYHCLYCESMGSEHWARDLALFTLHMQQHHDGRMIKDDPSPEEPPPEEVPA